MNRLEDSPLFQSLNTLIDRLTEIWGSGKGEPSVPEILETARLIQQLGEQGQGFLVQMQEVLAEQASDFGKESAWHGLRVQLSQIVAQCKEEASAASQFKEMIASIGTWRESFQEILQEIKKGSAQHAPLKRQLLGMDLEWLHTQLANSQLEPKQKLELRRQLVDLEERLQLEDADIEQLAQELDTLRLRLLGDVSDQHQTWPELNEMGTPLPPPPPPPPTVAESYYGAIKPTPKGYGFIVPYDTNLLKGEDIWFHISVYEIDNMPALGTLVVFENVTQESGQPRPKAGKVRRCREEELASVRDYLDRTFGHCPANVGMVAEIEGRREIATDTQGVFQVSNSSATWPVGVLVEFEIQDAENRVARIVSQIDPSRVFLPRQELLERIFPSNRPTPSPFPSPPSPETKPVHVFREGKLEPQLRLLQPGAPASIGRVREIQMQATVEDNHQELVSAVNRLAAQGDSRATWFKAMFLYSHLTVADLKGQPLEEVLDSLVLAQQDWLKWNIDGIASFVYKSLLDFSDEYSIDKKHIYRFFSRLCDARGHRSHYRLEIILARLSLDLNPEGSANLEYLQKALNHVKRALNLNPRILEATKLQQQILQRIQESGLQISANDRDRDGDALPADRLPEDYLDAVGRVKEFYKSPHRSDLSEARDYFQHHRPVFWGRVLGHLIVEHCQFLLSCREVSEAESILTEYALSGNVFNWQPLLQLLFDVWSRDKLPLEGTIEKISLLQAQVPDSSKYIVDLGLASCAYGEGKYDEAIRYAQQSYQATPTAEAKQLVRRAKTMLGVVAAAPDQEVGQRRVEAQEALRRTAENITEEADHEKSQRIIDLVLEYMKDPDVGPWLVHELVVSNSLQVNLEDEDRKDLVTRAKPMLREPSVEIFIAESEVYWGENTDYRKEGGLVAVERSSIENVLREPTRQQFEELYNLLSADKPWCTFVFFDCLSKENVSNLEEVLWYRALSAKLVGRKADYFKSALPCCLSNIPTPTTSAIVANALLNMNWHGLAFAVAQLKNADANPGIRGIVLLAEEKCQLAPWEWPLRLQEAKRDLSEDRNRFEAADKIIRVLLTSPTHWSSCRAFFDIFTSGGEENPAWGHKFIELALAVLRYLNRQPRFQNQPELLVLEAQLRWQQAQLDNTLQSDAENECRKLCEQAYGSRAGFQPAISLVRQLEQAQQATFNAGDIVANRYVIQMVMGRGSFGLVYKAEVKDTNWSEQKFVALKRLHTNAPNPEERERRIQLFEKEAEIAKALDHPHIVKTYEFIKSHRCLVMEFIDGWTLADKLDYEGKIQLPWQSAARIGLQIADALRYVRDIVRRQFNSDNFVHRDIHPRNIMVMRTPENPPYAKLLDFGLARIPGGITSTLALKDVNRLMSYRDFFYGKGMDWKGDMFSLGVIIYELITGEGPYPVEIYMEYQINAKARSKIQMPERFAQSVPQSLRPLRQLLSPGSDVPKQLEDILLKMVAFNPSERYTLWEELIDDLKGLLK